MYVPADDVELVLELVHSGVVIVALGGDQVESAAVLGDDLLQQVVRHFLRLKHKRHRQHTTERHRRAQSPPARVLRPSSSAVHAGSQKAFVLLVTEAGYRGWSLQLLVEKPGDYAGHTHTGE